MTSREMMARMAWFVVAAQLAATLGHADPANPVDPANPANPANPAGSVEDAARARLDLGIAAYRAGDFARAVDEFFEANRLAPELPDPYRWLALAQAEIDDCRSALINIDAFAARTPAGDDRMPELVALRDRCLHTGTVDVDSIPTGARIRIDGGPPVGTTPARRLAMRVGPRLITVEKPGFASQSHRVEVRASGVSNASFALVSSREDTPLVRRWWFWAAIGAVAVTAIGLTYDSTQSEPRLPPVTCTPSGCRP